MEYVILSRQAIGKGNLLEKLMRARRWSSPDFETRYGETEGWHCELSGREGCVTRELGIDASGNPVSLGPIGRNAGIWVGMALGSLASAGIATSRQSFEDRWRAALSTCGSKAQEEVRWLVTRAELIGVWTTAAFGGASEEEIEFSADGSGVILARDYDVSSRDSFLWNAPEAGVIVVEGKTSTDLDDEGRPRSGPSRLHFERRNVSCRTAYGGSGQPISILELDVGVEPFKWVHGPFWRLSQAAS